MNDAKQLPLSERLRLLAEWWMTPKEERPIGVVLYSIQASMHMSVVGYAYTQHPSNQEAATDCLLEAEYQEDYETYQLLEQL